MPLLRQAFYLRGIILADQPCIRNQAGFGKKELHPIQIMESSNLKNSATPADLELKSITALYSGKRNDPGPDKQIRVGERFDPDNY
jgi:hypothetical protein